MSPLQEGKLLKPDGHKRKRGLSHDNPPSINLKSNTMKNTLQK